MPFGYGMGFRWMYYASGLPGWARYAGYGNYRAGYWQCWRFPWLPRGWWTGIYGPVQWTAQGPQIVSSNPQTTTEQNELTQLQEQAKAIEQEIANLQNELAEVRKRIEELNKGEK